MLAELIERVSGSDFRDFVRTRVIEPLGLPGLQLGVPAAEQGDINPLVRTGAPATPDELEAVLGIRELPMTEVTTEALLGFNQPEVCAVGVPGGGGVSTAADLALFYQALLHDPLGMWKPEVLADVTSTVRNSFPDFMGTPANRTRGLVVKGDDERSHMRGMGRTVSARAFGHNGAAGQIAWGDPETGRLVLFPDERHRRARDAAVAARGCDREPGRQLRGPAAARMRSDAIRRPGHPAPIHGGPVRRVLPCRLSPLSALVLCLRGAGRSCGPTGSA